MTLTQDIQKRIQDGDYQIVNVGSIGVFHALIGSGMGFLGGCGKPHVKACNCKPCKSRKARKP